MPQSIEQMAVVHREEQAKDLALLDRAQAAIQEATTVAEAKQIKDEAHALEVYAKRVEYGSVLQQRCTEIKLRAERKAGELLRKMALKPGPSGDSLSTLNISRNESSRWQKIATIPDEVFAEALAENPTESGLLRLASSLAKDDEPTPEPPSVDEQPEPNQSPSPGYWVLSDGEGLDRVSAAAGIRVVALLDGEGTVVGYLLDEELAEQMASILNAMT